MGRHCTACSKPGRSRTDFSNSDMRFFGSTDAFADVAVVTLELDELLATFGSGVTFSAGTTCKDNIKRKRITPSLLAHGFLLPLARFLLHCGLRQLQPPGCCFLKGRPCCLLDILLIEHARLANLPVLWPIFTCRHCSFSEPHPYKSGHEMASTDIA